MIRVNCFYSEKEFIVKNIKKSLLSKIFNLNDIDWDLCDLNAQKSLVKRVCDYYNLNPGITVRKLSNIFKLRESTISTYLYKGNDLGFCNYKPINKIPIMIQFQNINYTFNTINDCVNYLTTIKPHLKYYYLKSLFAKRVDKIENINIIYL